MISTSCTEDLARTYKDQEIRNKQKPLAAAAEEAHHAMQVVSLISFNSQRTSRHSTKLEVIGNRIGNSFRRIFVSNWLQCQQCRHSLSLSSLSPLLTQRHHDESQSKQGCTGDTGQLDTHITDVVTPLTGLSPFILILHWAKKRFYSIKTIILRGALNRNWTLYYVWFNLWRRQYWWQ